MKLSVVMPIYNERATVRLVVESVLTLQFPFEIELLCVDAHPDHLVDALEREVERLRIPGDDGDGDGPSELPGRADHVADLLLDVDRLGERAQIEADHGLFQPGLGGGDDGVAVDGGTTHDSIP